jgi:hypothetical protein
MSRTQLVFRRLSDAKWEELLELLRSTGTYRVKCSSSGMEEHIVLLSRADRNVEWLKHIWKAWGWLCKGNMRFVWVSRPDRAHASIEDALYKEFPELRPRLAMLMKNITADPVVDNSEQYELLDEPKKEP